MAKYRWGFETIENDNPIFTECFPIVEDGTSLDYAQQTNDVFYRAKLNGTITFRFDTFDYIIDAGYNAVHIVVLQRYDETESNFVEVWRGKFTLTDCTINYDTHTIDVTPETIDRYTAVLDNLEKEYNLVKLKAQMKSVNFLIRPCVQLYPLNSDKISNYIGGNYWESTANVSNYRECFDNLTLTPKGGQQLAVLIKWRSGSLAGKTVLYTGDISGNVPTALTGKVYSGNDWVEDIIWVWSITFDSEENYMRIELNKDNVHECDIVFEYYGAGLPPIETWVNPTGNVEELTGDLTIFYVRTKVNSDLENSVTINGHIYSLTEIPEQDIDTKTHNYNKAIDSVPISFYFSDTTSEEQTEWGIAYNGRYFVKPADTPTRHYIPINQSAWTYQSSWFYYTPDIFGTSYADIEAVMDKARTIVDCYDYRSTIAKLLNKAGVYPQYIISHCLGGTNDYVGARTDLRITPRSNVISSYYDTPAQNAPISLAKVLNMLKIIYQCYWYIDNNGNFHIEHISFFDNGYSTTEDEPELIVDLESELHTRTLNNKVFGQNQVKFDKQDMPEQYTFGWADSVTRPFIGYPINCLDKYVQQGNISEQNAADFDSDVDYVLSSPNDVSKDGFFLFALPAEGLGYSDTLKVENVLITDEIGDTFEVSIQNADAAFVKIHKTWWRYHLPCENINVNNEDTVALTTGSYKLQTLEFTDTAMADIIGNVDNCNKIIRTQQGDGHVKTLSINLNSLATKADLLFNFVGRWYYLRGTALGATITISVNGESVTIDVSNNTFKYRYKEPIAALDFSGTDVVSVNFADCDSLNNLTSADEMFKNCTELLAVDFANKTFGAVTTANDMFAGCSELTTLICPPTASWKADLDFSDCPNLTLESLNDLINDFLYSFDSGTHTITPNSTMWNALDGAVQDDIIARATAKGWTIAIPAQYSVTGTSAGSVVYATINGTAVEIDVVGGNWSYDYNTPISSIAFTNDTNLQTIDFSLSDGLASLTSLDNAFKGCTMLTAVDFTNCDLTNIVSAADCFAACSALFNVTIPANSWKPDVDFSDCALIVYAEMADIINSLYTYATGTHTITFNQTTWDSFTQAQQQTIFDAADAKGWTTNAVAVIYTIFGTSSNLNDTETFNIQYILDGQLSPETAEQVTVAVDGNGNWSFDYMNKKIYSLANFANQSTTILSANFTNADDLNECVSIAYAFAYCTNITTISFHGKTLANVVNAEGFSSISAANNITYDLDAATFESVTNAYSMFYSAKSTSLSLPSATFASVTNVERMFANTNILSITLAAATFASVTNAQAMFNASKVESLSMPLATFASATTINSMFLLCNKLLEISMPSATFAAATTARQAFNNDTSSLTTTINLPSAVFGELLDGYAMFVSTALVTLNLQAATMAKITSTNVMFAYLQKCTTINIQQTGTFPISVNFSQNSGGRLFTYQTMVNIANWLKDRSGLSAQTVTYSSVAWNALSSAEQATIQGILQGKNWNLATA